jgi:hypothetical protein
MGLQINYVFDHANVNDLTPISICTQHYINIREANSLNNKYLVIPPFKWKSIFLEVYSPHIGSLCTNVCHKNKLPVRF